jgi:predicted NAD/FAD-binding protein
MLGLSTPWDRVEELSTAMAMGNFEVAADPRWSFFAEGIYSYLALLCERMAGRTRVVLGAQLRGVWRSRDSVRLDHPDGSQERFDAVVFATTPDQVLPLLGDATPEEQQRFSPWESNHFPTVVHHDHSLYHPFGVPPFSGADFFERADGSFGYNTVLDGLGRTDPQYSFAYGLEDRIDPAMVIDRSDHRTPRYSAAAVAQREAIRTHNGSDRTFHAGAYLGNGLQEGAVASALEVSRRLGGRTL